MKNVYKQKREQGFTIIEVLIVLAIAALIFLIVFLAVPALNRSSRNNAVKNDAANLLSGISTFSSNNNGQLPKDGDITGCDGTGDGSVTIGTTTGQSNNVKIQPTSKCSLVNGTAPVYPSDTGDIVLGMNYKCGANAGDDPVANQRSVVALYLVETGSSATAKQCVES